MLKINPAVVAFVIPPATSVRARRLPRPLSSILTHLLHPRTTLHLRGKACLRRRLWLRFWFDRPASLPGKLYPILILPEIMPTVATGVAHAGAVFSSENGIYGSKSVSRDCSKFRVRVSMTSTPPKWQSSTKVKTTSKSEDAAKIAVLGASGYTGAEIIRLLSNHPRFWIKVMTADRKAGEQISSVFPHLQTQDLPTMVAIKDADFSDIDAVFCCLPHGTTQEVIKNLPKNMKIVDLSADFRLSNISEYEEWYGQPHRAPELQQEAIYGLTEVFRDEIRAARLVANPGCYPTSIQLPLIPLIKAGLIKPSNIIIDSKSGVSGAGRGAKEANLYTEIAEGIHAYGIKAHRHVPEIEQGLSGAALSKVVVSFTPNLICMKRGMQSTMFVEMAPGVTVSDIYGQLKSVYESEEFVRLLPKKVIPHTRHVVGSNYCFMNVFEDRIPGRAIVISVIDNLVKGASGQAVQNLNLMMGFPENAGLQQQPLFP